MQMKTETWVRLAAIGICGVIAALAGYVIVRRFAGILLPFLLAALVSSLLRPAAGFLRRRFHLPEKIGGTVLILLAVTVLSFGVVALGRFLYGGARDLIAELPAMLEDSENPIRKIIDLIKKWDGRENAAGELETLYGVLSGMIKEAISAASAALTAGAGSVIVGLPRLLLSVVVGVIALFYLFFDGEALRAQMRCFCSESALERTFSLLARMRRALGGYIRAYLTLLLLTYAELCAGFLILNVSRPFVIALIAAAVDLLPVFGVGTVLLPWSVFAFFSGDVYRGVGLLVLFFVMYVVRQFAEPRILGSTIGVHPLVTLFSVFAGFSLFGIWGMVLFPLLLYGGKVLLSGMAAETENGGLP